MIKLFRFIIIGKSKYENLRLKACIVESQAKEILRLTQIESEYKRLTDRDEKGRFVK